MAFELRDVKPIIKMVMKKSKQGRHGVRKGERSEHEEILAEDKGEENIALEIGD